MPGRGRGRGRGRGGRGRSAGRGGRGRGYRNFGQRAENQDKDVKKDINIKDDPKSFFTSTATAVQHFEAQTADCGRYCAAFYVLIKSGIKIAQVAKIRSLAIALGRNDKDLVAAFLSMRSQFGLVEVLKALTLLDAGRQIRILEKKLKCLELSANKVKATKLGKIKRDIHNLSKMKMPVGSASGSVCKHITRWVKGFTKDELEFYAIHFPKEPWKKLADICHFNPKDFPAAPWFLPHCFGSGEIPNDSLAKVCADLTAETVNELLIKHSIPFSVIKKYKDSLNDASKKRIAENEPKLDTLLWNYEDLVCPEVEKIIYKRIVNGEEVNLSNGKLLERLLFITLRLSDGKAEFIDQLRGKDDFYTRLIDLAEPKLTSIRLPLESPIAILGDASPSMDVAIRTSTIIASLLTSICSAKLVFFDSVNRDAPFLPKTVKDMLKLALMTRTSGATSPAASLYPFYERKEIVKTFIIVTDEEENRPCDNWMFAPLYKKYYEEVYPATLVFVSFLHSQHETGRMVEELNRDGFHPRVLKLQGSRPDLQKLDDLFGQLSSTAVFEEEVLGAEQDYKKDGVVKLFEGIIGIGDLQENEED